MRENRTYGSQGGEAKAFLTPIEAAPVREDADEPSEGVADVEAAHAPGLTRGFDGDAGRSHPLERLVDIVDLDRQIRRRRAGATLRGDARLDLHLRVRAIGRDPAVIHQEIKAEQLLIEAFRARDVRCRDIGNDTPDLHVDGQG